MALAWQCDRCKKYFSERNVDGSKYPYVVNLKKVGSDDVEYEMDLCPSCKDKLKTFLTIKEQQSNVE